MDLTPSKKYFLVSLPLLLLLSTAFVFTALARWLGKEWGYVLGFGFYDLFWCVTVPLVLLGKSAFLSLFREERPLFRKENWLAILLVTVPIVVSFFSDFIPNVASTPLLVIMIGIPAATVNGTCEEILWRGLYVKAFPNKVTLGLIYPAIGFAFWHFSPQLIFPAEGNIFVFVIFTLILGLSYGWTAYKTGSIRWTALSHSVIGILAFGVPVSRAIVALISS
jgi:membrane protease YdiL (CAAX protease family)